MRQKQEYQKDKRKTPNTGEQHKTKMTANSADNLDATTQMPGKTYDSNSCHKKGHIAKVYRSNTENTKKDKLA